MTMKENDIDTYFNMFILNNTMIKKLTSEMWEFFRESQVYTIIEEKICWGSDCENQQQDTSRVGYLMCE